MFGMGIKGAVGAAMVASIYSDLHTLQNVPSCDGTAFMSRECADHERVFSRLNASLDDLQTFASNVTGSGTSMVIASFNHSSAF